MGPIAWERSDSLGLREECWGNEVAFGDWRMPLSSDFLSVVEEGGECSGDGSARYGRPIQQEHGMERERIFGRNEIK